MDKWILCVVALFLGMLMANMFKNVCGCKTVEGQDDTLLEDLHNQYKNKNGPTEEDTEQYLKTLLENGYIDNTKYDYLEKGIFNIQGWGEWCNDGWAPPYCKDEADQDHGGKKLICRYDTAVRPWGYCTQFDSELAEWMVPEDCSRLTSQICTFNNSKIKCKGDTASSCGPVN